MTLLELYKQCEQKNIDVSYFPMKNAIALSFPQNWIAIDVDKIENSTEEKVALAHEMGHIETGSFYNVYSPLDVKEKHEYRANKHAIKKLIPEDELKELLESGITEVWDLAEYFEVTNKFMYKAMSFYFSK